MDTLLQAIGLTKTFILHIQGGARLPVLHGLDMDVGAGECLALSGPSGAGKSTLLRLLYGNYLPQSGRILVRHGGEMRDLAGADPRLVLEIRRMTMGFVSQFLRVIPRVSALVIVCEPLLARGASLGEALEKAEALLDRLNIPPRLWRLAPATFSGGEQQRVNVARVLAAGYPLLLLDEPTASLDGRNRQVVIELIQEAKARGAAVVGIFHDLYVRDAVADRLLEMEEITA